MNELLSRHGVEQRVAAREKLRILIYGLNFAPELTGIGKYTSEMAHWLQERGHDVRVITAPPYYPEWTVPIGYRAGAYTRELWNGIRVLRCPLYVPRRVSGLKRLLHLASFALSSLPVAIAQIRWRPQVVWTVEPTFFAVPGALLVAKLARARSWLHVQDYEIDAAFSMGLLKGRLSRSAVSAVERWAFRRFDRTSTISQRMLERAGEKGVSPKQLVHFPNWVDISEITPEVGPSVVRSELQISPNKIVVLYSGNMGSKQGLEVLAHAAELLADDHRIEFIFCGQGVGREDLVHRCKGLKNVRFLPLQPVDRLSGLLGAADIHVLPQRADAADLVLPSKLTGILASGRPVIATADLRTELGQVIGSSEAGELVPPGNSEALASAIRELAGDAPRRLRMGVAARNYAERELSTDSIMRRFEADLCELVE